MYWYEFEPEEIQLAEQQAYSQVSDEGAETEQVLNQKIVGNLGEYAVEAFLEDFAHPDRWEYLNEQARANSETEYQEYDFEVNGNRVDVKTTTNLLKLNPTAMFMSNSDQSYHDIDPGNDSYRDIYIFVLLDRNVWPVFESKPEGPNREVAFIIGWATSNDLQREMFVDAGQKSRPQKGVYLPFNDIYNFLLRLGCTAPHTKPDDI
jgi:hypothetical protein